MKISKDFLRFYIVPTVMIAGILLACIFTIFYTTTIHTIDGKIVKSSWPKKLTYEFSDDIIYEHEQIQVTEEGKNLLENNSLWLQILDENGNEIYQYDTPVTLKKTYTPYEFLMLYQNGYGENSVFINDVQIKGENYSYLIGFPMSISKTVMYIDTARYNASKVLIVITVLATILFIIMLTIFYNITITKDMEGILLSLKEIAARKYQTSKPRKFMQEIYTGIENLNKDIIDAEQQKERDEKAKIEWLANITHDLKTPLAPIRGYAEILSETDTDLSVGEANRYGQIMLKNTVYAEQLIDDLKLTYQLQSDIFPLHKETHNIIRFVKELVIDIMNMPEYTSHNILFESNQEQVNYDFDEKLLKRALMNIIVNACKHNTSDTKIKITVLASVNDIIIIVADQGQGMCKEDIEGLFKRYYRGTDTETKTEGTGLGMAIAKQIIEAHNGKIIAESEEGAGTRISIQL